MRLKRGISTIPAGENFVHVLATFRLVQGKYSMTDTIPLTVYSDLSDLNQAINAKVEVLQKRYDEVCFSGLL